MDSLSALEWAAPALALWEGLDNQDLDDDDTRGMGDQSETTRGPGTRPDGTLLAHKADLIRAWLLAEHGGVWADVTLLPLAPLDAFLPRALPPDRSFFAYTFPDPALSWEVSRLASVYDERDGDGDAAECLRLEGL